MKYDEPWVWKGMLSAIINEKKRTIHIFFFFAVEIFHIFLLVFSLSLFMMITQCEYKCVRVPVGFYFTNLFFPHCVDLMRNAPKWDLNKNVYIITRMKYRQSWIKNICHTQTFFFWECTHFIIPFYYCMAIIYLIMSSK